MQSKRTSPRPRVPRACEQCGAIFLALPSRIDVGKAKFCGPDCQQAARRVPVEDRFWDKVDRSGGDDACWIWTATKTPDGYGYVRKDGRMQRASRVAWEMLIGPIPDGMFVCHNCPTGDNPSCVNPSHLFLGTSDENNKDRSAKGRSANGQGSSNNFARLTESDVLAIRAELANGTRPGKLAERYNVSVSTIALIQKRKTWVHL